MTEPTYKPEQWVTFEQNGTGGFGQIIGGSFSGSAWSYNVKGALANSQNHSVKESEIAHLLTNGSWLAPTHIGGSGSAYTDTPPAAA